MLASVTHLPVSQPQPAPMPSQAEADALMTAAARSWLDDGLTPAYVRSMSDHPAFTVFAEAMESLLSASTRPVQSIAGAS